MKSLFGIVALFGALFVAGCEDMDAGVEKRVAITFDDGPDPRYTPMLLDMLAEKGVKASFFLNGHKIADHPDIVKRMHSDGHEIGNHSYGHSRASALSYEEMVKSLDDTDDLIRTITGEEHILYRAPYLELNKDSNMRYLCERGRQSIGVTMTGVDWETQDPEEIYANAMRGISNRAVILLHDSGQGDHGTRAGTVAAAALLIDRMRVDGFTFVPVSELPLEDLNEPGAAFCEKGVLPDDFKGDHHHKPL